jgi:hypothetical protein
VVAAARTAYPIRRSGASPFGSLCRYATDPCQAINRVAAAIARGVVLGPVHRYARQFDPPGVAGQTCGQALRSDTDLLH